MIFIRWVPILVGEMREKLTKFLSSVNFKILYATLGAIINGYNM